MGEELLPIEKGKAVLGLGLEYREACKSCGNPLKKYYVI